MGNTDVATTKQIKTSTKEAERRNVKKARTNICIIL